MSVPVGSGLPVWLDTEIYLSVEETRALGEHDLGDRDVCSKCHRYTVTEKAHIVRKMAGGRKKGTSGPTQRLCIPCHDELDDHAAKTMAVGRDGAVYWLEQDGDVRLIGHPPLAVLKRLQELSGLLPSF